MIEKQNKYIEVKKTTRTIHLENKLKDYSEDEVLLQLLFQDENKKDLKDIKSTNIF